jgi:cytochrome c-type biogenesis protein CcmH
MSAYLLPLALLVLLAAAFAVSVLWQRSRPLAIALAVVLPLAAAGLYAWRGPPAAGDTQADPGATPADGANPAEAALPPELAPLAQDLEGKLKADPDNWENWALLGRVRMEQGRFAEARGALAKAHSLVPDDNLVAVGYAEALLRASPDQRFPPEAVALLERAAGAEPPDERAVFFLGMHRMLSDQPAAAADLWESLLPRLDETAAAALRPQIEAARAAAAQQAEGGATADTGPALAVTVSIAPELAARAGSGAVLYVFARAPEGGPPVAVERVVPGGWPVQVTLSDADQAMPTTKLSDHARVVVTARLALGGDATGKGGDLESEPVTVVPADATPVALRLTQVRP